MTREEVLAEIGKIRPLLSKMEEAEDEFDTKSTEYEILTAKKGKPRTLFGLLLYLFKNYVLFVAAFVFLVVGFESPIILIFDVGIIALIVMLKNNKKKKIKETGEAVEAAKKAQENLAQSPELSWLPYTYRTFGCISKIEEYCENLRANSLSEAINLLELEEHQKQVELNAFAGAYYGNR